jgi:hypothetical protein
MDSVRNLCPCVIFIDSLDFILYDANFKSSSQHSSSFHQDEVDIVHKFAKSLQQLITDIISLNNSLLHEQIPQAAAGLSKKAYVISSTKASSLDSFPDVFTSIFPIRKLLMVESHAIEEVINESFLAESQNSDDPDDYLYSDDTNISLPDAIKAQLRSHFDGSIHGFRQFINEVRYLAFKRQHGKSWAGTTAARIHKELKIESADIDTAASMIKSSVNAENKQTNRIPRVLWSDIGGLDRVRKVVLDLIQLPVQYPHLFRSHVAKKSGILLFGPPGELACIQILYLSQ